MIKKLLLLVAIGVTSLTFGGVVQAQGLRIELGDRPYYSHGPRYWAGEYEMMWVPGHWSDHGHHWIHGHYVRSESRHHYNRDHVYDRERTETEIRVDPRR
ncbi:MAG TPA: hypothetical protein VLO30_05940 [Chthoniobacterales bacterium]|nr:hypothetical protein [Chthoniobacterales bacterium]